MSTHNICFHREIRKILCGYPLLSVAMIGVESMIPRKQTKTKLLNNEVQVVFIPLQQNFHLMQIAKILIRNDLLYHLTWVYTA